MNSLSSSIILAVLLLQLCVIANAQATESSSLRLPTISERDSQQSSQRNDSLVDDTLLSTSSSPNQSLRQPLHLEARNLASGRTAQCRLYRDCQHLAGNCCPSNQNVELDCCNSPMLIGDDLQPPVPPAPTPTPPATSPTNDAFCSSHSNCPNVDVECCPTLGLDRFYMDCCDNIPKPTNNIFQPSPPSAPLPPNNREPISSRPEDDVFLGPNVYQIDSSWSTADIQSLFDTIFEKQVNNEMGSERYAIYFAPGTYGSPTDPLLVQIGYYTEVAGLGIQPTDVVIHGKMEVYNRCFVADEFINDGEFNPTDGSGHCIALNNFWRSLANLQIQIVTPPSQDYCRSQANFWAVSQASSMRRVSIVGGKLSLMDFCTNPAFASGGFMADTFVQGQVENGSQQQWISRNIHVGQGWSGAVWNQVFVGSIGGLSDATFPDPPVSTVADTPLTREKPFLVVTSDDQMAVFVPTAVTNTRGVSWDGGGSTPGKLIPLEDFLIATPSTSAQEYRVALAVGKHLLFTPGVYNVYETIRVERAHTVVLGLGHATLTARNGVIPLQTSDSEGIILAGITIDAGPDAVSPVLLQVGDRNQLPSSPATSNPIHPITLSDVYIRVGGPYVGKSDTALEVNAHHVLIDHTWIWRADHGIENFDKSDGYGGDNERWRTNTGVTGTVVNGNSVIAMGLFVEHFQQHNLIWNGENGKVYMFQSELVYEPASQNDWIQQPSGILGYEAYKVGNNVQNHYLLGGGVYCYNRNNPNVVTEQGFSVPKGRTGIVLEHIMTRNLSGPGIVRSIVNGIGRQVDTDNRGPYYLERYASGDYKASIARLSDGITGSSYQSKEQIDAAEFEADQIIESSPATSIQKGNRWGTWGAGLVFISSLVLVL